MAGVVIEGAAEDQRTAYVHYFQTLYKGLAAAAVGAAGTGAHNARELVKWPFFLTFTKYDSPANHRENR